MNLDPRFKSDDRANVSQPDPLRLQFPDWFPGGGIGALLLAAGVICAPFLLWWDVAIAHFFASYRDAAWVGVFRTLTALGNSAFWYAPAVLGFGLSLWIAKNSPQAAVNWEWRRRARSILFVIVSMMASGTIVNVLKVAFGRHRPRYLFNDGVTGFEPFLLDLRSAGFPSGHTQSITAAMVAFGFLWPKGRLFFWGLAVIVASSRFIITVHYTGDVIAGAAVAISVAWAMKRYFERNGITLAWNK